MLRTKPVRVTGLAALSVLVVVLPTALAAPAGAAAPDRAAARGALSAAAARAFRSVPGVVSGYAVADGLGPVIDTASTTALRPASTQKLFTAGAALLALGPSYRFPTSVTRTGSEPPATAAGQPPVLAGARGVLHGDLVLTAGGDPTLTSDDLAALARQVRDAGVREVTGELWLDDSLFDRQRGGRGWSPGWVGREAAPLSAFVLDGNWGRDAVADPAARGLARWRAALVAAGVTVRGASRLGAAAPSTAPVATHLSTTLDQIVLAMDKVSDNTTAELLLKAVGASAGDGSSAGGAAVVRATAGSLGVRVGRIVDGSGLSSLDRVDARTEVAWLQALDATPVGPVLRASVPVACTDGTLRVRLCGAWAAGRVQAKTGTLGATAALCGWTTTQGGRRVWFSFLIDRTDVGSARAAIDRVVTALAASPY